MWYANILSGYQTAERNFMGNAWNAIDNLATSMIADPKDAKFALWGFMRGIGSGVSGAANVLKTGNFPIRGNKYEASSALELNPFTGMARILNNWKFVMRSLYGADMLFFKPAQESRAMMIAADIARNEGLSGTQLWRRANEIMGKTGTQQKAFSTQAKTEGLSGLNAKQRVQELAEQQRDPEMMLDAMDYARRVTFNYDPQGQLGAMARAISNASRHVPVLRLAVPFTRIVANVANTTIDHTPWGFIRVYHGMKDEHGKLNKTYGHLRAQALAKAAIGTIAMETLYIISKIQDADGDDDKDHWFDYYGAGPGNTGKQFQLEETGWKPYSIKLGKTYIDYRLTPLAIPLAIIGNIRDAERWKKYDERSILSRASYAVLKSASTIFDMSFLSGINQIVESLQRDSVDGSKRVVKGYISRTAGTLMPSILKQIDRLFDDKIRDNSTIEEGLLREIPVVSHWVKPKLNLLGEPVEQTSSPTSIFFSKERSDPVWKLIVDKEAFISTPDRDPEKMDEDGYYRYVRDSGKLIKEKIERNLNWLQKQENEKVRDVIRDYVRNSRGIIKNRIQREGWKKND